MGYIVTAPLVIAKNGEGGDLYVYEGAPVPEGQSEEWIEQHLDQKMIAEGTSTAAEGAPPKSASKEEWVDFAVEQGVDPEEAEKLSKADLIKQYG